MKYGFSKTVEFGFDKTVDRVTDELKKEGFEVLTTIGVKDVAEKLEELVNHPDHI